MFSAMMQKPSRPLGITFLAIIQILIGVFGLLISLAIIAFSALLSALPAVGALASTVGLVIGGVFLFFSLIWLAFFFSSRRRHTRFDCDWSSDVCSSDLMIRHTRFDCDWSSDVCSSD